MCITLTYRDCRAQRCPQLHTSRTFQSRLRLSRDFGFWKCDSIGSDRHLYLLHIRCYLCSLLHHVCGLLLTIYIVLTIGLHWGSYSSGSRCLPSSYNSAAMRARTLTRLKTLMRDGVLLFWVTLFRIDEIVTLVGFSFYWLHLINGAHLLHFAWLVLDRSMVKMRTSSFCYHRATK